MLFSHQGSTKAVLRALSNNTYDLVSVPQRFCPPPKKHPPYAFGCNQHKWRHYTYSASG